MLSAETIATVKQTLPVLEAQGEALTHHFYRRMFAANPEVQAFFNPAHQRSGAQQRALASAICAYARHIDNLTALADAVELIAHKHASLGVEAAHYPIVGEHLLGAIQELLELNDEDPILSAWGEAYEVLARTFIDREKHLYEDHRTRYGRTGFSPFRVTEKRVESNVITSFLLQPADGSAAGPFLAGQYLTVRVPLPRGGSTMRNYSICSPPGAAAYRIAVKREDAPEHTAPAGYVSNYLHDEISQGDSLEVGPPCGEFTLRPTTESDRPLVLLSAGVGITPCLAMLHSALADGPHRPTAFIHTARNSGTHAFADEVADLAQRRPQLRVHIRYSEPLQDDLEAGRCDSVGFVDEPLIRSLAGTAAADFYFCGPAPFMTCVNQILDDLGVPPAHRHHEFFGPAQPLESHD